MVIIALDLSTKSSGYAVFNNRKLVESGVLTASSTDVIKRIYDIRNKVNDIVSKYPSVDKIILEEVRPEGKGTGVGNLHTQKVLMWLQASINFLLHDYYPKTKIEYVYPSEWRSDCGIRTGRGIKRDTLKQASIDFVKQNYSLTVNDDEADAIGIGHAYVSNNLSVW